MDTSGPGRGVVSPEATERLRGLYARIQQHERERDEFALALLEVKETEGVSLRQLARAVGIGKSTVDNWLRRARQIR